MPAWFRKCADDEDEKYQRRRSSIRTDQRRFIVDFASWASMSFDQRRSARANHMVWQAATSCHKTPPLLARPVPSARP
eukprot:995596-Pyramimonas_sp.AAC.1